MQISMLRSIIVIIMGIASAVTTWADTASGTSGGINLYSGKRNGRICNECHFGGTTPIVTLEGPTEVAPGATATYRFVVQSQSAAQTRAGLDVAASLGTLGVIPGQSTKILVLASQQDLTHTTPKQNTDGRASWEFTWQAPLVTGPQTLFAAGNSVNGDGLAQSGDKSAAATLQINVVAAAETPTPTPTSTIADSPTATATETIVPPTATLSATATATATTSPEVSSTATAVRTESPTPVDGCAGDCNGNSEVTVDELVIAVGISLGSQPRARCLPVDFNQNGEVTIDELVRAVGNALNGC